MPVRAAGRASRAVLFLCAMALGAEAAPRRPPPAHGPRDNDARDPRQEKAARIQFDRAEKAFNLGRFDEALTHYQAAYEALPLPAFVFNIAQCHRNLGNGEQAVFFYQRYLSLQPDAPNRPVVEELIAEQTRQLEERKAAEAATTPALAVEEPPGPPPAPRPPAAEVTRQRALPPPPPPAPPHNPRLSPRWWVIGLLGASVLGGVAFLVVRQGGDLPAGQLGAIDTRR
jgi:tetratricopeptide (TPR) repeat protein